MDKNMAGAGAHSTEQGAGAWPDRMPDALDGAGKIDVTFTNSMGGISAYTKSDELNATKAADAFNRADYSGHDNTTREQDVLYSAGQMPTRGK